MRHRVLLRYSVLVATLAAAAIALAVAIPAARGWSAPAATAQSHPQQSGRKEAHSNKQVTIGLFGDDLYKKNQLDDVDRLVKDMNQANLDLAIHDGDLTYAPVKPSYCSKAVLRYDLNHIFNALKAPVIYTPGDNGWTDCGQPNFEGSHGNVGTSDPLKALDNIRSIFFNTPYSLGQNPIRMQVQSQQFPENRRVTVDGVPIATLNVQGSLNGCEDVPYSPELAKTIPVRQAANRDWLCQTFQ